MLKDELVAGAVLAGEDVSARLPVAERRRGVSEYERAGQTLAHAVDYLVTEQLQGRVTLVPANRAAIAILCEAGRALEAVERREPARGLIAGWMRRAGRNRRGG